MATEVISAITGLSCTVISSIVTFILTRRKYNSEVDSQQIKNMKEAFDAYKGMTDETVESLRKKIGELQKENDSLRTQFVQLQTQMVNLMIGEKFGVTEKTTKKGK